MSKLATRLKTLRQEKNLTQKELGEMFGVGKTTVSMWENGNSSPDDDIKDKLAIYFDVSVDYLLGRTDKRNFTDSIIAFNTLDVDGLDDSEIEALKTIIETMKAKHKK